MFNINIETSYCKVYQYFIMLFGKMYWTFYHSRFSLLHSD